MTEDQFLSAHTSTWHELESICQQMNKQGLNSLKTPEIKNFLNLFKLASHHLAYAKTHYTNSQTIVYLNNLIGQCNTYVYPTSKPNMVRYLTSLFSNYSQQLKKYRLYILFAFGIFLFSSLLSFIMVYLKPEYASLFLDSALVESLSENSSSSSAAAGWNYPLMSSYIMVNNITVSLKAFIFGITLGIGTAYILFQNGLLLGSITALFYLYGDPVNYWSLILPHGITELTAIFISGAAGLIIAKSFLIPGSLSRKHSLIYGTHEAIELMGGVVILLIIAGLIEGFFTPLNISTTAKFLMALLTAVLLAYYFLRPYLKPSPLKATPTAKV